MDDFKKWEQILKQEWLWDLDEEEWFMIEASKRVDDIINLDIEELEKKLNIKISIDFDNKQIFIYDKEGYEIWKIEPWIYNMHKYETTEHLYKKVNETERRKWYGTILMNLYKKHFWLPNSEASYKRNTIKFLSNFWYKVIGKIINWEVVEVLNEEIENILYWNSKNDELATTYILVLEQ